MRAARLVLAAALLASAGAVSAHHAPNSFVRFDFEADRVQAEMMIPASELGYALEAPEQRLPAYLLAHVSAATARGAAWKVTVTEIRSTTYLEQPYFVAALVLSPPAGGSARDFVFDTDAVTHEVRNHVVYLLAARDYADASLAAAPELLGALQYPARQLAIHRPTVSTTPPR